MGTLPQLLTEQRGRAAVAQVFRNAGLPLGLVERRETRLPMAALVRLFAEATEVAGDPLFGLRVGLDMEPEDYGLWMRYGLEAPTLRAAIARLTRTMALHQSGPSVDLTSAGDVVMWRYIPPPFPGLDAAQHADHIVPTMVKVAQRYLGPDWLPAFIEVPHDRDPYSVLREDQIGTGWRFSGAGIGLPLAEADLDRPRPFADGDCALTLRDVSAAMRGRTPCFTTVVGDLISLSLLERRADIEAVASRLDLPVRTLQRRLSEEATTFREVLASVRRAKAAELATRDTMRVAEIAMTLGYADPSNYQRAAKRWRGASG